MTCECVRNGQLCGSPADRLWEVPGSGKPASPLCDDCARFLGATDQPTDEELTKTIARACGWTVPRSLARLGRTAHNPRLRALPAYTEDLNAMHEAEKTLEPDAAWLYNRELNKILGTAGGMGSGAVEEHTWHATARQRALAFYRLIEEAGVTQFMAEYDAGKHPLSAEDEAALERSRPALMESLAAIAAARQPVSEWPQGEPRNSAYDPTGNRPTRIL